MSDLSISAHHERARQLTTLYKWQESGILISWLEYSAVSAPCGLSGEGLTLGLQIAGQCRDSWSVLHLAYAFDQLTRGSSRNPRVI